MSTPACLGIAAAEKVSVPKQSTLLPKTMLCWVGAKYVPDCHLMWSAITFTTEKIVMPSITILFYF